jgi:uncharacterized protein YneF (UPF0154 family)
VEQLIAVLVLLAALVVGMLIGRWSFKKGGDR